MKQGAASIEDALRMGVNNMVVELILRIEREQP